MLNIDESQTFFIVKNPERPNISTVLNMLTMTRTLKLFSMLSSLTYWKGKKRAPIDLFILKHEDNVQVFITPYRTIYT